MITIKKGKSEIIVSRNQFETQFKSLGYQIASNENEVGATKEVAPSFDKEEIKDNEENLEKIKEEEKNEKEEISSKYGLKDNKKKGK